MLQSFVLQVLVRPVSIKQTVLRTVPLWQSEAMLVNRRPKLLIDEFGKRVRTTLMRRRVSSVCDGFGGASWLLYLIMSNPPNYMVMAVVSSCSGKFPLAIRVSFKNSETSLNKLNGVKIASEVWCRVTSVAFHLATSQASIVQCPQSLRNRLPSRQNNHFINWRLNSFTTWCVSSIAWFA